MKRFLWVSIALLTSNAHFAQTIDSLSVKTVKTRDNATDPWEFFIQQTDSFSTGLLISGLQRKWDANTWNNQFYTHYTYSSDTLTERLFLLWDTTQWSNSNRSTYSYSASIDTVLNEKWNSGWTNDQLQITYYDSLRLDTLILYQKWNVTGWRNFQENEKVYSSNSLLSTETFSNWDTTLSQWNYSLRYIYQYDSTGNFISVITQRYGAGAWRNYEIAYSNGSSAGWIDADSAFSDHYNSAFQDFDSAGRLIHVYNDYTPGGFSEYFYYYDMNGVLIREFSHSESQGGISHEYDTQWLYFNYPGSSLFVIFANDSIADCQFNTILLSATIVGGVDPFQYSWSPSSAVSNDSIASPYMVSDTSGSLILTVTDSLGNSGTDSVYATVYPLPYLDSLVAVPACIGCNNGMFVFSIAGGTGFTTYNIIPNISGAIYDNDTISGLPAGIYTICTQDQNGCGLCITDTIYESTVSVQHLIKEPISIFPNPFSSSIQIQLPENSGNIELQWINQFGQCVRQDKLIPGVNTLFKENLPSGLYTGAFLSDKNLAGKIKIIIVE